MAHVANGCGSLDHLSTDQCRCLSAGEGVAAVIPEIVNPDREIWQSQEEENAYFEPIDAANRELLEAAVKAAEFERRFGAVDFDDLEHEMLALCKLEEQRDALGEQIRVKRKLIDSVIKTLMAK